MSRLPGWEKVDQSSVRSMNEENVLSALAEKPLKIHALRVRLISSGSEEELHVLLMRMRDAGKLKFDIHSGRWSAAAQ